MVKQTGNYHFFLDSFIHKNNRFFGWGWIVHSRQAVRHLELVAISDGKTTTFPVTGHLLRNDIKRAFPEIPASDTSGFRVAGFLEQGHGIVWLLRVTLLNDELLTLPLVLTENGVRPGFRYFLRRGYDLLRQGRWREIGAKIRSRFYPASRKLPLLPRENTGRSILVIDHGLGGGTSKYAEQRIQQYLAAGNRVLLAWFDLPALSPQVTYRAAGKTRSITCNDEQQIFVLAARIGVKEILINHSIGFCDPLGMVDAAIQYKLEFGATVEYPLHDFLPVCPAWHLIDHRGLFCNIPGHDICTTCLAHTSEEFTAYIPVKDRQIEAWRLRWQGFFANLDKIQAFSAASVKLLLKAYPDLSPEKIIITPHLLDTTFAPVQLTGLEHQLCIGIIGTIGYVKGARIVLDICNLIEARHLAARIVVVGTLEGDYCEWEQKGILSVTGRYQPEQLPAILQQNKVNYSFLPSVWPETFSFVVSELMALQLPIAVFDLGAPAERVAHYTKGVILSRIDPVTALEEIVHHAGQLRDTTPEQAGPLC